MGIFKIVLTESKVINGKKLEAGTVIAQGESVSVYTSEVDLAMQLSQAKIVTVEEPKKAEKKKDKQDD